MREEGKVLKLIQSRVGVISVAFTLIISILALLLLNGGVAWFSNNSDVSAGDMSIKLNSNNGVVAKLEFFAISSVTLSGGDNIYAFSDTPMDENAIKALGTYSTIGAERQLLIKITLKPGITTANISATSTSSLHIVENKSYTPKQNGNPLSSVVEIYKVENISLGGGLYTVSSANIGTAKRFANMTEREEKPYADFSPTISFGTVAADSQNAIYLMVDYYAESMEYLLAYVRGLMLNDISMFDNLGFVCDFEINVT